MSIRIAAPRLQTGLIGGALVVGIAAITAIAILQHRSDRFHRAQTTIGHAEGQLAVIRALPWGAASPGERAAIANQLLTGSASLRQDIERLPDGTRTADLRRLERPLERSLWSLLARVGSGERDQARAFNREVVRPKFGRLLDALGTAAARYDRQAASAEQLTVIGSAATVALALALLGLLVVRVSRTLGRAERAEAGLARSEQEYRLLFEHNPDPMWVSNPKTLRFLAVNDAAVARYGYSHEEFLAMPVTALLPPDQDLGERPQPGTTTMRQLRTCEGEVLDVEISASAVTFEGRPGLLVLARDVTDQRRAATSLRYSEIKYRDLFENATAPIATLDLDDRVTEVNEAFARLLGYSTEEMIGRHLNSYLVPSEIGIAETQLERKLRGDATTTRYEQQFIARDGRHIILEVETRLLLRDGIPVGTQGICHDITAQRVAEDELREQVELNHRLATFDSLTGLPNRGSFQRAIAGAIAPAGCAAAVLLLDLDHFKQINDTLGHEAGDELLRKVAHALRDQCPSEIVVARLGSDEFGILVSTPEGPIDTVCENLVQELSSRLREPLYVGGLPLAVEATVGIARFPADGENVDRLLQRADIALDQARKTASGHAYFTHSTDRYDPARLHLLSELRGALDRHELVVHYQPSLALQSGGVSRVEALVRWQHPTRGLLGPFEFIEAAEQTSLIGPLTLYVVERAAEEIARLREAGLELDVAINLSARNLADTQLPDKIALILAQHDVAPDRLLLEVTESAIIEDPQRALDQLRRLDRMGVLLAVDDFGKGYTSLASLGAFPFHQLKIDRAFISDIEENTANQAIVRAIINLAHDIGLEVVAEGIETAAAHTRLRDWGCDFGQGFLYAPALPPAELTTWLVNRREVVSAA